MSQVRPHPWAGARAKTRSSSSPLLQFGEWKKPVLVLLGAKGKLEPEEEGEVRCLRQGQPGEDRWLHTRCARLRAAGRWLVRRFRWRVGALAGRPPAGGYSACCPFSRACQGGMGASCPDEETKAPAPAAQPGIHPGGFLLLTRRPHQGWRLPSPHVTPWVGPGEPRKPRTFLNGTSWAVSGKEKQRLRPVFWGLSSPEARCGGLTSLPKPWPGRRLRPAGRHPCATRLSSALAQQESNCPFSMRAQIFL